MGWINSFSGISPDPGMMYWLMSSSYRCWVVRRTLGLQWSSYQKSSHSLNGISNFNLQGAGWVILSRVFLSFSTHSSFVLVRTFLVFGRPFHRSQQLPGPPTIRLCVFKCGLHHWLVFSARCCPLS